MISNVNDVVDAKQRTLSIKEDFLCLNQAINGFHFFIFLFSGILLFFTVLSVNYLGKVEINVTLGCAIFLFLFGVVDLVMSFRAAKAWLLFDKEVALSLAQKELLSLGLDANDNNVFVVMDDTDRPSYQCDVFMIIDKKNAVKISFSSSYKMTKKFIPVSELATSLSQKVCKDSIKLLNQLQSNLP